MKCCYRERSKIIPVKPPEQPKTSREFTELFWGEALTCGVCKQTFTLRQHEVVAYCGGCYKFLHCGIAGKCVGPNCTFQIRGETYKQTWCQACIPTQYLINLYHTGSPECDCLCHECAEDPNTHKKYKRINRSTTS